MRDWHALWLVRRGHLVHVMTDPACLLHYPARPGSRLDRVSRGVACPLCARYRARLAEHRRVWPPCPPTPRRPPEPMPPVGRHP